MTTKLTEAEVQALPVCRKCKTKPTLFSGTDVGCNGLCDVPILRVDTWRLLMTPEAKGEEIEHLKAWISNLQELNVTIGKVNASLQSKLAKSEERVKAAGEMQSALEFRVKITQEERDSLKQQLAEATKPVGDEELEKVIARLWNHMKYWTMEGGKETQQQNLQDYNTIIRAARQRKPSGDAIELAKWLKQESLGCSCADCTKAAKLCDSIIAQAGDNKEYEVTQDSGARMNQLLSDRDNARVPSADFIVDQPYHIDPTPQIGLGDFLEPLTFGDCTYFINFDAKRILNDTERHEPKIRLCTPEEAKDVERRRSYPKVILSGIDATQYDFHRAEQAIRAILGNFQLVLDAFTFLPRKENEPHADAYDSGLRPAADLLTAEERNNAEKIASSGTNAFWSEPAVSVAVALLRLAPAPSAATPDPQQGNK